MKLLKQTDNQTIIISETILSGQSDISTAEGQDGYSTFLLENNLINDYKVIRSEIKNYIYNIIDNDQDNWDNLSENEKTIAGKQLINKVPSDKLITIPDITEELIVEQGNNFNLNSINARKKRMKKAEEKCFLIYDNHSCLYLLHSITGGYNNQDLNDRYIKGIEELTEDGYFGIIDFIYTLETDINITTLNGLTKTQAMNILLEILKDGVY